MKGQAKIALTETFCIWIAGEIILIWATKLVFQLLWLVICYLIFVKKLASSTADYDEMVTRRDSYSNFNATDPKDTGTPKQKQTMPLIDKRNWLPTTIDKNYPGMQREQIWFPTFDEDNMELKDFAKLSSGEFPTTRPSDEIYSLNLFYKNNLLQYHEYCLDWWKHYPLGYADLQNEEVKALFKDRSFRESKNWYKKLKDYCDRNNIPNSSNIMMYDMNHLFQVATGHSIWESKNMKNLYFIVDLVQCGFKENDIGNKLKEGYLPYLANSSETFPYYSDRFKSDFIYFIYLGRDEVERIIKIHNPGTKNIDEFVERCYMYC